MAVAKVPVADPFAPAVGVAKAPVSLKGVTGVNLGGSDPLAFDVFNDNFGLGDFFRKKY